MGMLDELVKAFEEAAKQGKPVDPSALQRRVQQQPPRRAPEPVVEPRPVAEPYRQPPRAKVSPVPVVPLTPAAIAAKLRSPGGMREALILSMLLERPSDRRR